MAQIRDIRLLLDLVCILVLAGCQNDAVDPDTGSQQYSIEMIPLTKPFLDVQGETRADYDHLPVGYVPYNVLYPTSLPEHKTIGVFMTPHKTSSLGNFIYEGVEGGVNVWKSTVIVTPGHEYYIYGFMPREDADGANISPLDGDYSKGAVLSIVNYKTLTSADVCVLVGLRNATAEEKISGPAAAVPLGKFYYKGMESGKNYIFVLLKHLYAGIHFETRIDHEYHRLRSIKIRKMELEAQNISEYVNLTATLTANDLGNDPVTNVTYDFSSTTTNTSIDLFEAADDSELMEVLETAESFLGCFAPSSCNSFVLRTTYNVYDSMGNLIRENCVAENKFTSSDIPALGSLDAGNIVTLRLLIKPTYLYVLSDPDLDNPTITLTTTP